MKEKAVLIVLPCDLIKKIKEGKPKEIFLSVWWLKIISSGLDAAKDEK